MKNIHDQWWERRGNMIFGEDNGPGTAPFIQQCDFVGEAQDIVDAHNAALKVTMPTPENELLDGEVVGTDQDGCLIVWNLATRTQENCGDTAEEYGFHNLTLREMHCLGIDPDTVV